MSTRLGFRPRPVDANRQLNIVRDENELDKEEEGKVQAPDGHPTDKKHDEPKKPKEIDIPIPPVTLVPTYQLDYLPLHAIALTYLRVPSKVESDKEFIEYDLDLDDAALLRDINRDGQDRLSDRGLEKLLWRLETANAAATERSLSQAGATAAERSAHTAAATTDHLPKAYALDLMHATCRCQEHILERVFDYWKRKRKAQQKPSLRRLQAPTPESDNNPFLVFRQRAKPNRPQTRRRRETQEESLEKLKAIRQNLEMNLQLARMVVKRERMKLEIVNLGIDAQQFQLRRICERTPSDELEKKLVPAVKARQRAFDPRPLPKPGERYCNGPPIMELAELRKRHKRKRPRLDAVESMPLPPACVQPTMGFLYDLSRAEMRDALDLSLLRDEGLRQRVADGTVVARIGRGGRVYLDHQDAPDQLGGLGSAGDGAAKEGDASSAMNGLNGSHGDQPKSQHTASLDRLTTCLLRV